MSKVVYDELSVDIYSKNSKLGPMTVEKAKELLGYVREDDEAIKKAKVSFGDDFKFREGGVKVRLNAANTNRPFRLGLAKRYANEIIRGKFKLNGESVIIDDLGNVQDRQHTLVGLILAEGMRKKNTDHWKEYGVNGPCKIEIIVVKGISHDADTVDTINLGQKRSLGDVIYRNNSFTKGDIGERKGLSNTLAHATRLAWLRLGGMTVSDAPHFPHSEALQFLEAHPGLIEAVGYITTEDGGTGTEGRQIRAYISLGYASALCYLMATSKTKADKFAETGEVDVSMQEKAQAFWTAFASGADLKKGSPILALRQFLKTADASGAKGRDSIVSAVVLAWNAFVDGKDVSGVGDLKVKTTKKDGKEVIVDLPRIGGIDIHREPAPAPAKATEEGEPENKGGPKKSKGKGPGKKGPGKSAEAPKFEFAVGDEVFVVEASDPKKNTQWKGRVREILKNGKVKVQATFTTDEEGKYVELDKKDQSDYTMNPAEGDYIGHKELVAA